MLVNLDGLSSLSSAGSELYIRYNQALPTCEAEELMDSLIGYGWTGEVCIDDNLTDTCTDVTTGC